MTTETWDIEAIVREVVRRLQTVAESNDAAPNPSTSPPPAGQLKVDQKVVSLAVVQGRLGRVKELVVRSDAVVTPAVRDLLRRDKIRLVRADGNTNARRCVSGMIIVAESSWSPPTDRDVWPAPCRSVASLSDAVAQLVRELSSDQVVGVLITDAVFASLCQLNRHDHVRAAWISDAERLREAIEQIRPNVLVLDPRHRRLNQLTSLAQAFFEAATAGEAPSAAVVTASDPAAATAMGMRKQV